MNILVVDDHPTNRRLLRAVLEAEGINVFEANDGIEALAILAHDRIDAVIADILMPRMDGYRLCHEIRTSGNHQGVPIIIYSATYTSARDEQLARDMGADRFLRKPAGSAQLLEVVRDVLSAPPTRPRPAEPPAELRLMRNYSEQLVAKLEERNLELEEARVELREANALLEWRVQKRTEELAVANEQLDSFASFVAHELRSPLRSIGGHVRQLVEDHGTGLTSDVRQVVDLIQHTAAHAENLTEALLKFCRLGAHSLRRRRVDLGRLVDDVLRGFERPIRERGVEVVVHPLPETDADPLLLEHAFQNLVANALKFTRQRNNPRVEIGVAEGTDPMTLFVRDNGLGFDMRYAHLVFEPFQRLEGGNGFEGWGLGLSLVRNVVVRHGGTIRVESSPDVGTTFFVTLSGDESAVAKEQRAAVDAGADPVSVP